MPRLFWGPQFGARRVRAGVELEAGWSSPSPSPVRGRLLFSGPVPCGWGNQRLGATLVCRRAKLAGARTASLGSRGLTQIPGSHPDLPCLCRLGEVCVIMEPDPQGAGDLTGLHDGVWGSTAPFPSLSAELTPLGCLDQPRILTSAVTREPDALRSTWPGPHPPAI